MTNATPIACIQISPYITVQGERVRGLSGLKEGCEAITSNGKIYIGKPVERIQGAKS